MTPEEQLACERECTRLCHDFAHAVDLRQYDAFVALFTVDGVFERAGQASRGHGAIRSFLDARPADRITRHLCTNLRIDMTGPDAATGTSRALMFQATAALDASLPQPVAAPMVVDYLDQYERTAGGWKFKRRQTTLVLVP